MGVGRTYPLKDLCVIVLRIASDSLPSDFPYRKITPMKVGERENDLNHLILLMKKKKKGLTNVKCFPQDHSSLSEEGSVDEIHGSDSEIHAVSSR